MFIDKAKPIKRTLYKQYSIAFISVSIKPVNAILTVQDVNKNVTEIQILIP